MEYFDMINYHRKQYLTEGKQLLKTESKMKKPNFITESEKLHNTTERKNVIRILYDSYDDLFSQIMTKNEFLQLLKNYINDTDDYGNTDWSDFSNSSEEDIISDFEIYWRENQ